jgi:Uma2 family endonuclease
MTPSSPTLIASETQAALELPPKPDVSHLVTEDDVPVDNLVSEKQQRLLVMCLYSSLTLEESFLATANVGLFYALQQPALVPDVMLSLEVEVAEDWEQKEHRSYFVWEFGKPPEVAIEIVSNKIGNELGSKLRDYARAGVAYYVVFDPLHKLGETTLRVYELRGGRYVELASPWLEQIKLGLILWNGSFEGKHYQWLRWCDSENNLLLTGDERAEQEHQRAERLAELLRAQGIDPERALNG